ncbi:MAG: hypothetical protein ACRCZD_17810 [Phycicoccus sp.]
MSRKVRVTRIIRFQYDVDTEFYPGRSDDEIVALEMNEADVLGVLEPEDIVAQVVDVEFIEELE